MNPTQNNLVDEFVTDVKEFPTLDKYGEIHRKTVEIQPQRTVSGTSTTNDTFTRGPIDFNWNIQNQSRYIPSLSYIKCEVELTADSLQPSLQDGIALAENFMSNICSSVSFYIGNKCISRCDDYVGQTSMIYYRTQRSYNWLTSIGKNSFYLIPSFKERQSLISANYKEQLFEFGTTQGFDIAGTTQYDKVATENVITFSNNAGLDLREFLKAGDYINYGVGTGSSKWVAITGVTALTLTVDNLPDALTAEVVSSGELMARISSTVDEPNKGRNTVQCLWQPPLGIFQNRNIVLGAGSFRLKYTPKSNKLGAIQMDKNLASTGDLQIKNFVMVNTVFQDSTFNDGTYYIMLDEYNVQNKKLNNSSSLTSHNFTVPPTTHSISVFSQDGAAGSVDLPSVTPSLFKDENNSNVDIRHLQLFYAGTTKPVTLFDSSFTADTNHLPQRYEWNSSNCGMAEIGGESYEDWLERGIINTTKFIKEKGNNATELQLQTDFGDVSGDVELFVASLYRNIVKVTVKSGFITLVQLVEN